MSEKRSFWRKVIYLCCIAVLLIPLYQLGNPAAGPDGSGGGTLARLRKEHKISQASLGEIDPGGEAMKLSTLGMRGIAVNLLWLQANKYKRVKHWEAVSATVNTMVKLQPNFIKVWEFQAHNLSYNISVEFDDYEHRYEWVKKGIKFLAEGTRFNENDVRLSHQTGWFLGQKIGRADEHEQFRRLFREDEDFHLELDDYVFVDDALAEIGGPPRPDNWLVGRLWYLKSEDIVTNRGVPIRGKSPLLFYADAPMSLINFAGTIEKEGYFGDLARNAWSQAYDDYVVKYGNRDILTSWGVLIKLEELERVEDEVTRLRGLLEKEVLPEEREELEQRKIGPLTPEERAAYETPPPNRTPEQAALAHQVEQKLQVTTHDIASAAKDPERRERAIQIAAKIEDLIQRATRISRYRGIVNYEYWKQRCEVERTPEAVDAREILHVAEDHFKKTELEEARVKYEAAWDVWAGIFAEYQELMKDVSSSDLMDAVKRYLKLLEYLDVKPIPPKDFKLIGMIKFHSSDFQDLGIDGLDLESLHSLEPASPESGEPTPADGETPTPAESGTPTPAEPAPAEPAPAEPTPAEPAPAVN